MKLVGQMIIENHLDSSGIDFQLKIHLRNPYALKEIELWLKK